MCSSQHICCGIWGSHSGEDDDDLLGFVFCRLVGRYQCLGETYCLYLQGCRRRQYDSPKHLYLSMSLHSMKTQNININIHIAVIHHQSISSVIFYWCVSLFQEVGSPLAPINSLKHKLPLEWHLKILFLTRKTYVSVTEASWLIMFRKLFAWRIRNSEMHSYWMFKQAEHTVTIVF